MTAFNPVSKLFDRKIHDPQGEAIGRVRELLIDCENGQIEYVRIGLLLDDEAADKQHRNSDGDRWQISVRKATLERLTRSGKPNACAERRQTKQ